MWVEIGRHQFDLAKVRHVERCVRLEPGAAPLVVHLADGRDVDLTIEDAAVFTALFRDYSAVTSVAAEHSPMVYPGSSIVNSARLSPGETVGVEEAGVGEGDRAPDAEQADVAIRHASA